MNERLKDRLNLIIGAVIIFGVMLACLIKPATEISKTERRFLTQLPEMKWEELKEGRLGFTDNFEKYAADQFPMRENFRKLNASFSTGILRRKESNKIYFADGYLSKLDYAASKKSMKTALGRMENVLKLYPTVGNVYLSVIPDKNYYLSSQPSVTEDDNSFGAKYGYPYLNFREFQKYFVDALKDKVTFIDISDKLTLQNYYKTDTHWRQETLTEVASVLSEGMGNEPSILNKEFTINQYTKDFEGVYYGQAALPVERDEIKYLTGDYIEGLKVQCFDTGKAVDCDVYDFEKAGGMDAYELFLSGSLALMSIENPVAASEKELILFRDSFGSSIAPLLAADYRKVTLVDIRYINPAVLKSFVNFDGADLLFLYSTQVLNSRL